MRLLLLLSAILTALTGMGGVARAAQPVTASAAVASVSVEPAAARRAMAIERLPARWRIADPPGIAPRPVLLARPRLFANRRRE